MQILFLGDIVGELSRTALIEHLSIIKCNLNLDFIIANGENAAGGKGITAKIAIDLLRAGVSVITTGDHAWDQHDIVKFFPLEPRLLRPLNYPPNTPGNGSIILETEFGKIAVMQLQGRAFMNPPLENPYLIALDEVERLKNAGCIIVVVDFHAEATSEKIALGRLLDGKVTAVIGTHTHVQTADEVIFPNGTGYITDAGMCGPVNSILGRSIDSILWRMKTSLPTRMPIAEGVVRLCGVVFSADDFTGKCLSMQRFCYDVS